MEVQTIKAARREAGGKGAARKLRRDGLIPAVAYGGSGDGVSLTLDPKDLTALRSSPLGWNQPVEIEVDGGDKIQLALLRDVQRHPVSGRLLHADFVRLDESAFVEVWIRVRIVGRAAGQELGGLINQPRREVLVSCLPAAIPGALEVDVTPLEIGDKILLSSLELPEGVRSVGDTDVTLASCVGRRGGGVDAEAEDAEGEGEEGAEGEGAEGETAAQAE